MLSNVRFHLSWTDRISSVQFNNAGLSSFNSTLLDIDQFGLAPSFFWATFPSVLTDGRFVTTVPPYSTYCKADPSCNSFFFPGGTGWLSPSPQNKGHSGTALVIYDAPGVQLEFYSPSQGDELFSTSCRIYGFSGQAIQLCLQANGNEYIAGKRQ